MEKKLQYKLTDGPFIEISRESLDKALEVSDKLRDYIICLYEGRLESMLILQNDLIIDIRRNDKLTQEIKE